MKVPYSWLKEHIPTALSLDAISTTLTLAGLEVDAVTTTRCLFTDVVTAQVIACSSHPESELLKIATIDDGVTQTTVVCKAANCRKGLITAFAKVGATLPHKESTRTITSTTIRGIASDGMLCGLEDLGIESTSDGIVEFDDATALGLPVERLLSDSLFEISLTPNLGHCFSIHGVARELSSFTHEPVVPITGLTTHRFDSGKRYQISLLHDEVMEFHLCLLDAVVIKPSKPLIQNRLKQCGIKPINNVIDALHYAMMEYGQPFHAYDADQLNDSTFSIACTTAPTPFKGLDGIERILPENVLTVFNGSTPVAAAGVIGSFDTMVTPATRRIAIEMASFSPQGVRRGMKKLGMRSESGAHFEKGLDRKMMMTALSKAIQLIEDSLGTPLQPALQSIVKTPYKPRELALRPSQVNRLIGLSLSTSVIESLLQRIGCRSVASSAEVLTLEIPSWRNDIQSEIDCVEEVARLYGFNQIEKSEGFYRRGTVDHSPVYRFAEKIKNLLLAFGLNELVSCNLISPMTASQALCDLAPSQLIHVLHAKSIDQSVLRPTLLHSLIHVIAHQFNHQIKDLAGFELGRVHFYDNNQAQEKFAVGIVCYGKQTPLHFSEQPFFHSFYSLKGFVEQLLDRLEISYTIQKSSSQAFHPGQQATILVGAHPIGYMGMVHPEQMLSFGIAVPIYFAQLDIIELMHHAVKDKQMTRLDEFPASTRDLTLTLDKKVRYEQVVHIIDALEIGILQKVECLHLFTSAQLGENRHNLTLRLTYRSTTKTLDFDTVEKAHQQVCQSLSALTAAG